MAKEYEMIWVKSGPASPGRRVALLEYHEAHPNGQAFVYGDDPVQVAATPVVGARIREEFLVEVRNYKPEQKAAAQPEEEKQEEEKSESPSPLVLGTAVEETSQESAPSTRGRRSASSKED